MDQRRTSSCLLTVIAVGFLVLPFTWIYLRKNVYPINAHRPVAIHMRQVACRRVAIELINRRHQLCLDEALKRDGPFVLSPEIADTRYLRLLNMHAKVVDAKLLICSKGLDDGAKVTGEERRPLVMNVSRHIDVNVLVDLVDGVWRVQDVTERSSREAPHVYVFLIPDCETRCTITSASAALSLGE